MMQAKTMVLIVSAVACSALGQLCLKAGAHHLAGLERSEFLLAAARDPRVVSGVLAWAASTVCWLYALRAAPLSQAYPLSSLSYVIIPLASIVLFGEQIRRLQAVGIVLILIGVICLLSGE